jgi:hypothetical protein
MMCRAAKANGESSVMARFGAWRSGLAGLAATTILLSAPARAGCSFSDIGNAVVSTLESAGYCAAACADGVGCGAAAAVASVLAGVAGEAGQGTVNSFCSAANGDISSIVGALQAAGASSDALSGLANALSVPGDPLTIVQCACDAEQGVDSLGDDLGDCVADALCDLQSAIFGDPCNCTPTPPSVGNCSAQNKDCSNYCISGTNPALCHPQCMYEGAPAVISSNAALTGDASGLGGQVVQTVNASGTFIQLLPGQCGGGQYCFCPSPMQPLWIQNYQGSLGSQSLGSINWIFSCQCPAGMHPGAMMSNGISACLCDNTNKPVSFSGPEPLTGWCPPPNCANGQERLAGVGPCVTPCANPNEGMTFDGSCCDPAQMTSCGKCCPPGTTPDPATATCLPPPPQPK